MVIIFMNKYDVNILSLCDALLSIENSSDLYIFLKDLCTPRELASISERWLVCKLLNDGLSYREIYAKTGVSLTTIARVARFLKVESYGGYDSVLKKIKNEKVK